VIAPASANTIAKLAGGAASDLLSSCALAATCPVIVAPAMNNHMYEHAATQANVATLRERGVTIVAPGTGRLASAGEEGVGRLAEPPELLAACEQAIAQRVATGGSPARDAQANGGGASLAGAWRGVRVLVTAGGTREPVDSVRFLGNSSSGRMGLALAEAARARGAEVTLVAANVALPSSAAIVRRDVATAAELELACRQEFPTSDVLLMAAAVADFRPISPRADKIKKSELADSAGAAISLELEPTTDVLATLAADRRPGQTLVGFAAEHGQRAVELARCKLDEKRVDAIVVNDISREDIGFDVDANEVTIIAANGALGGELDVGRASKAQVAEAILDAVAKLRD
jgi:phosphopantothenoylcysteine decarboxylase/phosphopantothenate--cysteine ligase